ncbi:hypothetical protein DDB_G0274961 [Dictyostelium discoideum AX4]|uniref:DUSP domain-containing protein n=1 Tax=Dictyostelium discoideum TaxID=44689 RepID=Q554U6_DICDI|nr:hypothetical protein DDB_G0274961 [Dictyostelium discoideum AX4]EAL70373.1 hypothetical protein DDB_G0274961 [Dictyostelium discoideum AX4]|eukprot:XP_644227.1 hypothetical protein DDB_G0274961 [Dictyostelium discoideum AX4]
MFKILFGFIPSIIKTFSNFKNMNDIYQNLQHQQKNVSLFHLGHWVRIKVGGQPFIVRRKTLNKYSDSILSGIAHDDKITTKTITEILSKPSSMFENMFDDNQPPPPLPNNKNSKPPPTSENELKSIKKQDLEYQETHKNLPTIVETTTSESSSSSSNNKNEVEEQIEIEKKKYYNNIHNLQSGVNFQHGENDEFETSINNETGEKKFKFEKDHDGFYLIDRDPVYFNVILNFLRTGVITIPPSLDIKCLIADSKFYRLNELELFLNDRVLEERRNLERLEILKNEFNQVSSSINNKVNNSTNEIYFILPMNWFVEWKRFIDGSNLPPTSNIVTTSFFKTIDGLPIHQLKDNLQLDSDYICISKETFLAFNKFYKMVGPIIMRQTKNIYDNPPYQFLSSKIWNIK